MRGGNGGPAGVAPNRRQRQDGQGEHTHENPEPVAVTLLSHHDILRVIWETRPIALGRASLRRCLISVTTTVLHAAYWDRTRMSKYFWPVPQYGKYLPDNGPRKGCHGARFADLLPEFVGADPGAHARRRGGLDLAQDVLAPSPANRRLSSSRSASFGPHSRSTNAACSAGGRSAAWSNSVSSRCRSSRVSPLTASHT